MRLNEHSEKSAKFFFDLEEQRGAQNIIKKTYF